MTLPMHDLISVLGGTLLHFLWQGTVIGVATAAALKAAAHSAARTRYFICVTALLLCVVTPIVTALTLIGEPAAQLAGNTVQTLSRQAVQVVHAMAGVTQLQPLDVMKSVVGLWLIGMFIVTVYYAMQWRGVEQLKRSATHFVDPEPLARIGREVLSRWSALANIPLMVSTLVSSPMVIGLWRPIIVFPAATVARMPAEHFELILLHEIAHVLRRDMWINALQVALEITFFFHPAVHWLSRRTRLERECACDDFVVTTAGSAYQYGEALTALALTGPRPTALELSAVGGDLLPRLRYLSGECIEGDSFTRSPARFALIALLLYLALLLFTWQGPLFQADPFASTLAPSIVSPRMQWEFAERAPLPITAVPADVPTPHESEATRAAKPRVVQPIESAQATAGAPLDPPLTPAVSAPLLEITPEAVRIEPQITQQTEPEPVHPDVKPASELQVTYAPLPEYPVRARLDRVEGVVTAVVQINPDGRTASLRISEAEPLGVFEGPVRRALMRWRYALPSSEGLTVSHRLHFTLSGVSSTTTTLCANSTASRACSAR